MNDQHAHAGYAPSDGYPPGGYDADPLFGALPGHQQAGQAADHGGQYDSTPWDTGAHGAAAAYGVYATPRHDTSGQWAAVDPAAGTGPPQGGIPGQGEPGVPDPWGTPWNQQDPFNGAVQPPQFEPQQAGTYPYGYAPTGQFDTAHLQNAPYGYEATAQWAAPVTDTGAYDATAWNPAQEIPPAEVLVPGQFSPEQFGREQFGTGPFAQEPPSGHEEDGRRDSPYQGEPEAAVYAPEAAYGSDPEPDDDMSHEAAQDTGPEAEPATTRSTPVVTVAPRPERREGNPGRTGNRGRRRTPSRRSALLTVAVPSACVMGVAGIAAASVGGLGTGEEKQDDTKSLAAADPASVKPVAANNEMDTQLAALSADARDFGDRASRTQERIDLKARQDADRKKRIKDAQRKEALRPKYVIPVSQHGLSAYFGQAGVNWMSVHTGIDFPVSYGTPVMAATDGTVRTQWNSAYGNMAIVTSPEGTETWYCHLSSTKIRSGSVKAGEVIAFSGNSGNSTGPHLHFEVRPGAGAAIDPLPWLRSHGLDPT